MKVLMFGWEFPPFNSGGLGVACHGLTKSMTTKGTAITFVIPKAPFLHADSHVNVIVANNLYLDNVNVKEVDSLLAPYLSSAEYEERLYKMALLKQGDHENPDIHLYGNDIFEEVYRYADKAKLISKHENFDIIHAHDWMTYKAGMAAKEITGKPLVVHVHATDFDRTGGHPNQDVYDLEREGMHAADKVIAVSNFTKNLVVKHYGVPADKVEVVHNGVEFSDNLVDSVKMSEKLVLFLGRLTLQKGPDYFLYAARKVLEQMPDVKFVVAGKGDMEPFLIDKAAELGIGDKVLFTGFLKGADIDRAYKMADLYVMPSVSEPFGITPLEAMRNNTPVIISKQSGVSEVVSHCLKVDFWDIDELTDKMVAVLKYPPLKKSLAENAQNEVQHLTWDTAADKCLNIYRNVLGG